MTPRRLLTLATSALLLTLPLAAQTPPPGPLELTSPLGRPLYALPDDPAILAARNALAANPADSALALKLSLALAARRQYNEAVAVDTTAISHNASNPLLYLERGHRELGLRQFTRAQADLERAVNLGPDNLDSHYHLGLALYFQGHFHAAADSFARARALAARAPHPDDSLIDCSAWLYNAYRRDGNQTAAAEVLSRITPQVTNTEPHLLFYLRLLHFYQGRLTAQQVLPPAPAPNDSEAELSFATTSYGVGNWYLSDHKPAEALPLFKRVVQGQAWNAWGFIGSETELIRLQH